MHAAYETRCTFTFKNVEIPYWKCVPSFLSKFLSVRCHLKIIKIILIFKNHIGLLSLYLSFCLFFSRRDRCTLSPLLCSCGALDVILSLCTWWLLVMMFVVSREWGIRGFSFLGGREGPGVLT